MTPKIIPILVSIFFTLVPSTFAELTTASDRHLIVTDATAEVSGQNDSAVISVAVLTEGGILEQVAVENDDKTGAVLNSIRNLKVENLKFKTTGYRVTPQRDYKARPARIIGYEVFNTIEITLEGLAPEQLSKHVSDIFGKALHSGANSIQSVRFYIQNRESLENSAIKEATRQAMERAQTLAEAAGVKLKRIVSLGTEPAQMPPQSHLLRAAELTAEAAPPIESGAGQVRVRVSVAYEIEPLQ